MKNLYDDAMGDPVLAKYLPSKEQLSGKLPEREFFFGVLCTLKQDYIKEIIAEASKKRFKPEEDETKKQAILISDKWMEELMKHPYHSSKTLMINLCREARHRHLPHQGARQALQEPQEERSLRSW